MTDVGTNLRQAYYNALTGKLFYNGNNIPILDEKLDTNLAGHDTYVLMSDQIEDLNTNMVKTYFTNECLLKMIIVNRRKATNTREVVENISNQILTILFPAKTIAQITPAFPLTLVYARYLNGIYNPLVQNEAGFIISKTLTFKNRLTQ